jgi:hypothetical protein
MILHVLVRAEAGSVTICHQSKSPGSAISIMRFLTASVRYLRGARTSANSSLNVACLQERKASQQYRGGSSYMVWVGRGKLRFA